MLERAWRSRPEPANRGSYARGRREPRGSQKRNVVVFIRGYARTREGLRPTGWDTCLPAPHRPIRPPKPRQVSVPLVAQEEPPARCLNGRCRTWAGFESWRGLALRPRSSSWWGTVPLVHVDSGHLWTRGLRPRTLLVSCQVQLLQPAVIREHPVLQPGALPYLWGRAWLQSRDIGGEEGGGRSAVGRRRGFPTWWWEVGRPARVPCPSLVSPRTSRSAAVSFEDPRCRS